MKNRPVLGIGLGLLLSLSACGGGLELTDDQVEATFLNAVNNNGWTDVSPRVWADLAVESCNREAWDHDTNAELATEFLRDNGWTDRAEADALPGIIWLNLNIACHDRIPEGATPPPGSLGGSGG